VAESERPVLFAANADQATRHCEFFGASGVADLDFVAEDPSKWQVSDGYLRIGLCCMGGGRQVREGRLPGIDGLLHSCGMILRLRLIAG